MQQIIELRNDKFFELYMSIDWRLLKILKYLRHQWIIYVTSEHDKIQVPSFADHYVTIITGKRTAFSSADIKKEKKIEYFRQK